MLYNCKDPHKLIVLLFGPIGTSATNVGGAITHSGFGIKSGSKLLRLTEKSKAALRNKLSELKFLITEEICMVSRDLWTDINSRLRDVFTTIPKKSIYRSFSYDHRSLPATT